MAGVDEASANPLNGYTDAGDKSNKDLVDKGRANQAMKDEELFRLKAAGGVSSAIYL